MSINLNNISVGLSKVQDIAMQISSKGYYELIDTDLITPAKDNPYKLNDTPEIIKELADNIEAIGLLHPLTVKKTSSGYELISGERRFTAIKNFLGWKKIPCTVYENISPEQAQLMLHMANLEVREYTPQQKLALYPKAVDCIESLIKTGQYNGGKQAGVAQLLRISERQLRKYKAITNTLGKAEIEKISNGEVSINSAYEQAQKSVEKSRDVGLKVSKPNISKLVNSALKPYLKNKESYTAEVSCEDNADGEIRLYVRVFVSSEAQ